MALGPKLRAMQTLVDTAPPPSPPANGGETGESRSARQSGPTIHQASIEAPASPAMRIADALEEAIDPAPVAVGLFERGAGRFEVFAHYQAPPPARRSACADRSGRRWRRSWAAPDRSDPARRLGEAVARTTRQSRGRPLPHSWQPRPDRRAPPARHRNRRRSGVRHGASCQHARLSAGARRPSQAPPPPLHHRYRHRYRHPRHRRRQDARRQDARQRGN